MNTESIIQIVNIIGLLFLMAVSFFIGIAVALSAPIEYRFILRSILSLPIEGRKSIIKNLIKDCLN